MYQSKSALHSESLFTFRSIEGGGDGVMDSLLSGFTCKPDKETSERYLFFLRGSAKKRNGQINLSWMEGRQITTMDCCSVLLVFVRLRLSATAIVLAVRLNSNNERTTHFLARVE